MGYLKDGIWVEGLESDKSKDGAFKRKETVFRNWITRDGHSGFKAELNRYHLYVSLACPWAHRTLIFREIKGLSSFISLSVVHWHMGINGWTFDAGDYVVPDNINEARYLYQVYTKSNSNYSGRVTVPVLWDIKENTIVSNESSEIIRMFNSEFDDLGALPGDYYPKRLRKSIDSINERIYTDVNNGVYKCGFATSQEAYEEALIPLFNTLDWIEDRLGSSTYLVGEDLTEADWRLFTTLIRFDHVYVGHFKCNLKNISDYPNLSKYLSNLYNMPGISSTINIDHIKKHYYLSHNTINPNGIVPKGPIFNFL
tara:strand:- start:28788 stop:29723 length:936 start_codon:yes stop_codon:yes gene_type:complete